MSEADTGAQVNELIHEDLNLLDAAQRYLQWQFSMIRPFLGKRILEIGSGTGNLSAYLSSTGPEYLVLSDYFESSLEQLRGRFADRAENLQVLNLDIRFISGDQLKQLQDLGIDTIVAQNVLSHVEDDAACVRRLAEILPPGGRIIQNLPAHDLLYSNLDRSYGHHRRYQRRDLPRLAAGSPLVVEHSRYWNVVGFFSWLLLCRVLRSSRLSPAGVRTFDALAPTLRRLEAVLRLPFGQSLVAVLQVPYYSDRGFSCRSCGGASAKLAYDYRIRGIFRCLGCQTMQLYPVPGHDELQYIYNEDYFLNIDLTGSDIRKVYGYTDYISEKYSKQKSYSRLLANIKRYLPEHEPGSTALLDVGAGLGYFMESAQRAGFTPFGTEYNAYAVDAIRTQFGYEVMLTDDPSEIAGFSRSFPVITMLDVVEHLPDPFGYVAALSRFQSTGDILFLITMDARSLMSRLIGKRLEDFRRIQEHLFFFSRDTIRQLLEGAGYEVLKISSVGHSFKLGHLVSRLRSYWPWFFTRLERLIRALRLDRLSIYVNPMTKMAVYARKL